MPHTIEHDGSVHSVRYVYESQLNSPQIVPTGQEMVPTVIKFAQFLQESPLPYKPGETSAD